MKLTPANARDALAGTVLRDHEVTGLQLTCGAERKSWQLYYATRDGIRRRPTIGHFPEMSLSRARAVALELKDRVAKGEDPSGDWKAAREAPTVSDLAEKYLRDWVAPRNGPRWAQDVRVMLDRHILPGLGRMRVSDVTPEDVDRFLAAVASRKFIPTENKHGKASAPGTARIVQRILSKMFNYAQHVGMVQYDYGPNPRFRHPVKHSNRYNSPVRKVRADADTLKRLAKALTHLESEYPETWARGIRRRRQVACVWTLFLTGARVGEILNARTEELQAVGLVKTDHKTVRHIGDKTVPIPQSARAIIAKLPACPSGLLFGNISLRKFWARVRTLAECPDLRLQDARRTWASWARSIGVPLSDVADVFGHTSAQITHKHYSFMFDDAKAAMTERIASRILEDVGKPGVLMPPPPRPRFKFGRVRWRRRATNDPQPPKAASCSVVEPSESGHTDDTP